MPNEFNANDIFEMARQIEQNGAKFYRKAAEKVAGDENKGFLRELADMEDTHEAVFAGMQKELEAADKLETTFDPEDENVLYLKALADTRVFFKKEQPDDSFNSILTSALQTEKDSIVFYLGMKGLIPEKAGKSKIDGIISEEMGHIRILAGKLTDQS